MQVLSSIGDSRVDEETVINWSYFDCPSPCNTIPDHVLAKAFAMSRNNDKLAAYIQAFQEVSAAVAQTTGCKIEARAIVDYPAFHTPDSAAPVQLAKRVFDEMGIHMSVEDGAGRFRCQPAQQGGDRSRGPLYRIYGEPHHQRVPGDRGPHPFGGDGGKTGAPVRGVTDLRIDPGRRI